MKRKNHLYSLLFLVLLTLQSCDEKSKQKDNFQNKTPQEVSTFSIPTDEIVDEFYEAIWANDSKKIKQMLKTTFPIKYRPKNKIPPLQALIWSSDNLTLAKLFVEGGANINDSENPAILQATEYKRIEILKYLVQKGSDIKNNEAFNNAGFHQFYEGAKWLLLNGANQEKGDLRGKLYFFEQAVIKSDYEALNALHLNKDELNSNNCDGETALIIAIKQNNLEMVKYLLNKGVDKEKPETYDCGDDIYYGKMPVEIATANNFKEIAIALE